MSRFVPKIRIRPGVPPIYNDENERPPDHEAFGPDDLANAVKTLTEACKHWPDDFVKQIDHVDIAWAGYFQPRYQFVLYHNSGYIDVWGGTIILESRFQTPQEVIEKGGELAKRLVEEIAHYYIYLTDRETLLKRIVERISRGYLEQPSVSAAQ